MQQQICMKPKCYGIRWSHDRYLCPGCRFEWKKLIINFALTRETDPDDLDPISIENWFYEFCSESLEEAKMKREYKTMGGEFTISQESTTKIVEKFFIDKRELDEDDIVRIPIKVLRQIITDAKADFI